MAGEWTETCFGEVASFASGKGLHKSEYSPTGRYPVMGSNGLLGMCDVPLYEEPVITIGRVGACGEIHRTNGPAWISDNALVVQGGEDCDQTFLYYVLKSTDFSAIIGGTTQPLITQTAVKALPMLLPPLPEQKVIAAVLGALDDKIELNRRMNATLEAMARALFQSWFVDFDPVRAKLDLPARSAQAGGRQPPNLDPATAALFPDSFQDSELGPIPKGWEVCPLSEKIELLSGGTPKTSEPSYWDGDIPWYSVKDAPSETDVWVIHTEKQVTKEGIANSAAQILPEGTTIISARGTVGKLALIGTPMAMNQSCYGVQGIEGYSDSFTYFSLRQATAELQRRTHGSVFDTITRQTFETLSCVFPPANLAQEFDRSVSPLMAQIRSNLHQSRTLATLRDTLLPKLLSGEIAPSVNELLI